MRLKARGMRNFLAAGSLAAGFLACGSAMADSGGIAGGEAGGNIGADASGIVKADSGGIVKVSSSGTRGNVKVDSGGSVKLASGEVARDGAGRVGPGGAGRIDASGAGRVDSGGVARDGGSGGAIEVGAGPGMKPLSEAIAEAEEGDVLLLLDGVHEGPVVIDKPLSLVSRSRAAIIRGDGSGSVVTVKAPGVLIEGGTVTGSGLLLETQDSGIFLSKEATGARVVDVRVKDNLIGVYVWGARDALVRGNEITGRRDLRMNERGNGVQIWNAPGARIEGNDIQYGRDGIFVTTSEDNVFSGNTLRDLRFGVHYMYTNSSTVSDNVSRGNHLGYAIMFSTKIKVERNLSEGDRDRGILFNYANGVEANGNVVAEGPEKCVFIYNSNKNSFTENLFSGCGIGIHFTGGSERNVVSGNAFIRNRTQVKYVGSRWVEWSHEGKGNFWSDHAAFDLDRDGVADAAYKPNDLVDQILWRFPSAKLLMNSPATQVLRWAQSSFPALRPGGVIDRAPLMSPPEKLREHIAHAGPKS